MPEDQTPPVDNSWRSQPLGAVAEPSTPPAPAAEAQQPATPTADNADATPPASEAPIDTQTGVDEPATGSENADAPESDPVDEAPAAEAQAEQEPYYGDTYEYKVVTGGHIDEPDFIDALEQRLNDAGKLGFQPGPTLPSLVQGKIVVILVR